MPLINYFEKLIYIVYVIRSKLGNFWYFLPKGKYNPYSKEILIWLKVKNLYLDTSKESFKFRIMLYKNKNV